MFLESMFPVVEYVESDRPIILGLDGKEISSDLTAALHPPFRPRGHLNSHRPIWCLGIMRGILQKDFALQAHSAESNAKIVYFSACVSDENAPGGVVHLLLRTTIGAAMTKGVGGETQIECFVRTIASPVSAPPKKKRSKVEGPTADFYQSGLQRMAERCTETLCTQQGLPGAPTVRDAVVALGHASTLLAGLVPREKSGS